MDLCQDMFKHIFTRFKGFYCLYDLVVFLIGGRPARQFPIKKNSICFSTVLLQIPTPLSWSYKLSNRPEMKLVMQHSTLCF